MAQSYYALMHGFMRAGATAEAHTVFRSYQASGHDAYTGWLAITKQLFAAGQEALARELVETREPQWLPDAELYEHILKSVCASTIESPFFYTLRTAQSARDLNNGDTYIHEALQVLVEMQVWHSRFDGLISLFADLAHHCVCSHVTTAAVCSLASL